MYISIHLFDLIGTGKTSTILSIAKKLNGPRYQSMVLELNASDDRGIDVVREQIKDFASSQKLFSKGMKLIILDECDQMTKVAQFALRRIIEKYTKYTRFCIICNYVNKIIPALQSRCMRFRFGPLDKQQVKSKLIDVCNNEKLDITDSALDAIIKISNGDMRKCLNVLQSCSAAYSTRENNNNNTTTNTTTIDEEQVYQTTGLPLPSDINSILEVCMNQPIDKSYSIISKIQLDKGLSLVDIVNRLYELSIRISYPPHVLEYLLDKLSDIEYRLTLGCNEKLQLIALCAIFQNVTHKIHTYKQNENQQNQDDETTVNKNNHITLVASDYDSADLV